MRTFNVRQFINIPRSDWPCGKLEVFRLEFDDKSLVETTTPRLELSSKLWDPLIEFPKTPVASTHILKRGPVPWKAIEDMMSSIYRSILTAYGKWVVDREAVWESIQNAICNKFYNECVLEYPQYARSIDASHLRDIYDHPGVTAERMKVTPKPGQVYIAPGKISKATKAALNIIREDETPRYRYNPIVSGIRSGQVKTEQLGQITVSRGFNTEINSTIQPTPILGDYYSGILDPAEMLMDSSLASKAILFQGDPLKLTEYANRKLQFSTAQVDLIVTGDCGSDHYAEIPITAQRLNGLDGMFFVHPDSKKLTEFIPSTGHNYIGQVLQFRTPILCKYRSQNCVCSTCYGELAVNIPYGTNVGTIASMRTMSAISQLVLKVKHVEGDVTSDPLIVTTAESMFIQPNSDRDGIYLQPYTGEEEVTLLIRTSFDNKIINGRRLPVLTKEDLGPEVDMAKHTQFREMVFTVKRENGKVERVKVTVSHGTRMSFMSKDFLEWFIDQNLAVQADGNYHVNLSTWDFDKPFLEMPNKHTSMRDFAAVMESFVRSTKAKELVDMGRVKQLSHYHNVSDAINDLYDLIVEKIPVSYTHVSIVALSMLAHKDRTGRWIPGLDDPATFATHTTVMSEGSLGALFAYEGGGIKMNREIKQYLNRDRPQHLLDHLLLPG